MPESRIARMEAELHHVDKDLDEIKELMKVQAKHVSELARVISSLSHANEEILTMRQRQHDMAGDVQKGMAAFDVAKRAHARIDTLEKSHNEVREALPSIQIATGWVFKAALGVGGVLSAVAAGVLVKGLV